MLYLKQVGPTNLYRQRTDAGSAERLTTSVHSQTPTSITPDGATLILVETLANTTGPDLFRLSLNGSRAAEPLISGRGAEANGELSPDGHWIAYGSTESGRSEIYVRPYPDVQSGRRQISSGGGIRPAWARNGREIFFLDGVGAMNAVSVDVSGSTFRVGTSSRLFDSRYFSGAGTRNYDVAKDGRFLMIKDPPATDQTPEPSLIVVEHWTEELKARVPTAHR